MPRLKKRLPEIRHHAPSDRARVRIGNRDFWLGPYGSDQAQAAYDKLISTWLANGRTLPGPEHISRVPKEPVPSLTVPNQITIDQVCDQFTEWADQRYRDPDGTPTREAENYVTVVQLLKERLPGLPACQFSPTRLITFRQELINRGTMCRQTINQSVNRVRMIFKWAVSRELCPVSVHTALRCLEPLRPGPNIEEGRGSRGSVSRPVVEKTLEHLPPMIAAFVVVLLHSGCRLSELCRLTTGMIDRSSNPWVVNLCKHKNRSRGRSRRLYFGPTSQTAMQPFLRDDDQPIFSPRYIEQRHRGKPPGLYFTRFGLSKLLQTAISSAGVEHWSLAQLRHSAAVKITDSCGIETAQQVLGHSKVAMTYHYAQDSSKAAMQAAKKIG